MYQMLAGRWSADRVVRRDVIVATDKATMPAAPPSATAMVPHVDLLSLLALLSARESEIATLVARGMSNKEVALELRISPWTVSAHLRRIFTKLDIRRRIELCLLLAQH